MLNGRVIEDLAVIVQVLHRPLARVYVSPPLRSRFPFLPSGILVLLEDGEIFIDPRLQIKREFINK